MGLKSVVTIGVAAALSLTWPASAQYQVLDSGEGAEANTASSPGDYRWTIAVDGGVVAMSGEVPYESVANLLSRRAGISAELDIRPEAPLGFLRDALLAIEAVGYLERGEAGYQDGAWALTGTLLPGEDAGDLATLLGNATGPGPAWILMLDETNEAAAEMDAGQPDEPSRLSESPSADLADRVEILLSGTDPVTPEPAEDELEQSNLATPEIASDEPSQEATPQNIAPDSGDPTNPDEIGAIISGDGARSAASETGDVTPDTVEPTGAIDDTDPSAVDPEIGEVEGPSPSNAAIGESELPADADPMQSVEADQPSANVDLAQAQADTAEIAATTPAAVDMAIASLDEGSDSSAWEVDITAPAALEICEQRVAALVEERNVLFASGSSRITGDSESLLSDLADVFAICPRAPIYVEGHTDADGGSEANLMLSLSRAESVVDALVELGVPPGRLYAVGYGASLPIAPNDTAAGKAQNRRIVFNFEDIAAQGGVER